MKRYLLATLLLLCASSAFAKSPASSDDPAVGSAKPGKSATNAAATTYSDPVAPQVPVAPPARAPGGATLPTRGGAPRWHSLLPGMIR